MPTEYKAWDRNRDYNSFRLNLLIIIHLYLLGIFRIVYTVSCIIAWQDWLIGSTQNEWLRLVFNGQNHALSGEKRTKPKNQDKNTF